MASVTAVSSSRSPTARLRLRATLTTRAPWLPRPRSIFWSPPARVMSSRPRRVSCGAPGATASTRSPFPTRAASALRCFADAPTALTGRSWTGIDTMQLQSFVAGKWWAGLGAGLALRDATTGEVIASAGADGLDSGAMLDRKSTRLNSSHLVISYAVFCLKKKNITPRYTLACETRCNPLANLFDSFSMKRLPAIHHCTSHPLRCCGRQSELAVLELAVRGE